MSKEDKKYDLIIWGASGFTGRLVAEYLIGKYGIDGDLKWAVAARNQSKLEKVMAKIGAEKVPMVIADSHDVASLNAMASQTKVICTTVGPYAKYGSELVAACIEKGTDYCDLTGEVQWMRKMIDKHHEAAKAKGVRIVHTCGFDSIPSDMGVYFLQKKAKEQVGEICQSIDMRVKAAKGSASGGTIASMKNISEEAQKDKSIYKVIFNPYSLCPDGEREGPDTPDLQKVVFDKISNSYIAPFIMATINTKVVRRSNALAGYPYGKDFLYNESMMVGKGFTGKMKGNMVLLSLGAAMAKPSSLLGKMVSWYLPKPGEGPNKEERENGFYKFLLFGKTASGKIINATVKGDRDPGYGSTCKMLGEAAVCLAKDDLPQVSGMLTPSVTFGDKLLERLEANAGLTFEIVE